MIMGLYSGPRSGIESRKLEIITSLFCTLKLISISLFQANWYKAEQYCRFHGMHLCSIDNADEQKDLQEHIQVITGLFIRSNIGLG